MRQEEKKRERPARQGGEGKERREVPATRERPAESILARAEGKERAKGKGAG